MTPDVNVLLAAARTDHAHHLVAAPWLRGTIKASATGTGLLLMPMVVASFLRLVTNPKVFGVPTLAERAIAYVDDLLDLPGVALATLGAEWPLFRRLCVDKQLTGNALPDAWLAAAVMQQGEHLVTFDSDFRKLLPRNRLTVLATT
ncbi:MAG: PIN domain-containing protein [Rhizobiales bacterium]|nr:PIN domain-containing protein [Rhizobacter sp.]